MHEFVNNQGLQCLVKIGGAADQNYQNYILRGRMFFSLPFNLSRGSLLALGQLMLYVDGMNAVMNQNEVVQWLYTLIESSVRRTKRRKRIVLIFDLSVSIGGENKFKIINRLC